MHDARMQAQLFRLACLGVFVFIILCNVKHRYSAFRDWSPLRLLLSLVIGWCMICFAYGIIHFIDAPLHACGAGKFCGKTGLPHTKEEYEAFLAWQTTLFISWPFGLIAGFFLQRMYRRERPFPPRP